MSDPKTASTAKAAESASTKSLRVKNPGPNPRHYFVGDGGLFAPGEVRDVKDPLAIDQIKKAIDKKFLHPADYTVEVSVKGKVEKRKMSADILLVSEEEPEVTAEDLFKAELKKHEEDSVAA